MSAGALRSSAAQVSATVGVDSLIKDVDVRRILSTLAADSMEGRKAGTRGGARAAVFIAAEMKSIGLVPVDSNGLFISLRGQRGIMKISPRQEASLEVSGQGLVGLAFAPGRSVILATGDTIHHLSWDIQGLLLPVE